MTTIACVYWKRPGDNTFPHWWVGRLQEIISQHVTIPYRFVCFSNVDVPCDKIELQDGLVGWWNKMEMFRPGVLSGRIFYLDLDTLILENIDELLDREESFIAVRSFNPKRSDLPYYFNASLMSWEADGSLDYLYTEFDMKKHQDSQWEQDYFQAKFREHGEPIYYWQELVDGIYSYKQHIMQDKITVPPRIVCFHGTPRPWDVRVYNKITRG